MAEFVLKFNLELENTENLEPAFWSIYWQGRQRFLVWTIIEVGPGMSDEEFQETVRRRLVGSMINARAHNVQRELKLRKKA